MSGRLLSWTCCALLLAGAGCSTISSLERSHPLGQLWQRYQELPPSRALVVAGDIDGYWVGAAAGGASSPERAIEAARSRCLAKRRSRRMQAPCIPYAVDDEIVWPPR